MNGDGKDDDDDVRIYKSTAFYKNDDRKDQCKVGALGRRR
jgi:hypothetical protein